MRITRLELENFKGIGERQVIELAPITLLFGANSAGKSTIIQALHYLREILVHNNVNADVTETGGYMNLGGFVNLVHKKEYKDRSIIIKVVMELSDKENSFIGILYYKELSSEKMFSELPISYILEDGKRAEQIAVEFEIKWNEENHLPFVFRQSVELDGQHLLDIMSPDSETLELRNINFKHPLLLDERRFERESVIDNPTSSLDTEINTLLSSKCFINTTQLSEDSNPEISLLTRSDDFFTALSKGLELWDIVETDEHPDPLQDEKEEIQEKVFSDVVREHHGNEAADAYIETKNDMANLYGRRWKPFEIQQRQSAENESIHNRIKGLHMIMDELAFGSARSIKEYLKKMRYLGPIREIPPRNFLPQKSHDESRWANGLAAWDMIYNDLERDDDFLDNVNYWLNDSNRLDTGYQFQVKQSGTVRLDDNLGSDFEKSISSNGLDGLENFFGSVFSQQSSIALEDQRSNTHVEPIEIGVGMSQILPIVICTLHKSDKIEKAIGIIAVEQPELHIHPRLQVRMGDLFIHAIKNQANVDNPSNENKNSKMMIIETHSEHLLLRLLRRIREKTEGNLEDTTLDLDHQDLSVMYVQNTKDKGVRFRRLRVTPDGDFIDRWPDGFFEERLPELFDDL